jgi:hypothetical protein
MDFLHDLCSRVIGQPEISTDGFLPYRVAIPDAFGDSASHGVIVKTYSVTSSIASTCEEIALRWAITSPPADYDGPGWA